MSGFRHLGDSVVHEGAIITLSRATFESPDGDRFERDVVRHPGAVSVVPLLDDGTVVLVRQYRGPIDALLLEIPAGLCDVEGEDPEQTARRELVEEVGRTADAMQQLAAIHPAAGFSDQYVRLYLATGLHEVPHDRQGPEEQHMTVETVDLLDVPGLIASGSLTDSKTLIGLLLAREVTGHR